MKGFFFFLLVQHTIKEKKFERKHSWLHLPKAASAIAHHIHFHSFNTGRESEKKNKIFKLSHKKDSKTKATKLSSFIFVIFL